MKVTLKTEPFKRTTGVLFTKTRTGVHLIIDLELEPAEHEAAMKLGLNSRFLVKSLNPLYDPQAYEKESRGSAFKGDAAWRSVVHKQYMLREKDNIIGQAISKRPILLEYATLAEAQEAAEEVKQNLKLFKERLADSDKPSEETFEL